MKVHAMLKIAVTLLCCGLGPATAAEGRLPTDVADYVEQRESCDHFRGEIPDPPDEQRMREIEREIRKLCTGTDQKLVRLKRKYTKNQMVQKRLNEFEAPIELPPQEGKL